jgi:L-glyceraldehyde 3-phosphate reductase
MGWPCAKRHDAMRYNRCGKSGVLLPSLSLGLSKNFGASEPFENRRAMLRRAFDLGITHFDLANKYGVPEGSAEETLGEFLRKDFADLRDELFISTKAGFPKWPGPYGEQGSRKHLIASLDQSLKRLQIDYVDLFYSHRFDPNTPLEETMAALDLVVRQGKALYVGISAYGAEATRKASQILRQLGTPCLIHQPKYSMLYRDAEKDLFPVLKSEGVGCIVFRPLAQGLLSDRYLQGIPKDSRAAQPNSPLKPEEVAEKMTQLRQLNDIAHNRGQTLSQMALAWVLRDSTVTSALIGASRVEQIEENVQALQNLKFTPEELVRIDQVLAH